MTAACRQDDIDTGHDNCPPTNVITFSPNVQINGKFAARVTDHLAVHGCDVHAPHSRTITTGDGKILINNLKAAEIGSSIDCGGTMATGSPNVIYGGPIGLKGEFLVSMSSRVSKYIDGGYGKKPKNYNDIMQDEDIDDSHIAEDLDSKFKKFITPNKRNKKAGKHDE